MMYKKQDNHKPKPTTEEPEIAEGQPLTTLNFSIVGIGASAGGLEAFEMFFQACPANTG
jgi:chemotaxis response regulator CheB